MWDWKTGPGGDGDGIIVDLTPSGTVRIITAGVNNTINTVVPTGKFVSFVVTIDSTGLETLYLDGKASGTARVNTPGINGCAAGATLRFGGDQSGGQKISGEVDRAAIFTTALSAADVAKWQTLGADRDGVDAGHRRRRRSGDARADARRGAFVRRVRAGQGGQLHDEPAGDGALQRRRRGAVGGRRRHDGAGHLVNGAFALPSALQVAAGSAAFAPVGSAPLTLLTYNRPISNDANTINLKQSIGANDALRTGSYAKTLTFTLSTTRPY